MYYIEQEIIVTTNTLNFKTGDKFIIKRIEWDYLFDHNDKSVHKFNVRPSFKDGDTVWDTHGNATFTVHHVADDQVYSVMPGFSSVLRGRPISRVRSGTPPQIAAPSTSHPDTQRLDWLLNNIDTFAKYVKECPVTMRGDHRDTIDAIIKLGLGNTAYREVKS